MDGYAVMAHVERVEVRMPPGRHDLPTVSPPGTLEVDAVPHLDDPSSGDGLGRRLEDLRTLWSQTTFYLFSPDSWR